jgi:hypothetical protein
MSRERECGRSKASVTYTFKISEGADKTCAEVMLTDGGFEVIEEGGQDPKAAAVSALERILSTGYDPLKTLPFLRIPYSHAKYFSRYGKFHQSFH